MTTTTIDTEDDGHLGTTRARGNMRRLLERGAFGPVPDELTSAASAHDRLEEAKRALHAEPIATPGDVYQRAIGALMAARSIDSFATDFAEAGRDVERRDVAGKVLERMGDALGDRFAAVVGEHLPGLLDNLREQLDAICDETTAVVEALGDLDPSDGQAVAEAPAAQREAVTALAGLGRRYGAIRHAQRVALVASDARVPGSNGIATHGWPAVLAAGIHEFADVRHRGTGPEGVSLAERVRVAASRPDVWVPTIEEMHDAWRALHEVPTPDLGPLAPAALRTAVSA